MSKDCRTAKKDSVQVVEYLEATIVLLDATNKSFGNLLNFLFSASKLWVYHLKLNSY